MRTQVFLNIVLDEAVEEKAGGEKVRIGMVVWLHCQIFVYMIARGLISGPVPRSYEATLLSC